MSKCLIKCLDKASLKHEYNTLTSLPRCWKKESWPLCVVIELRIGRTHSLSIKLGNASEG